MSEITNKYITITVGDKPYICRPAVDKYEREHGLMYEESLKSNEGMIFVLDEEDTSEVSFWMKDTPLHLDIVFISKRGKVISVKEGKPEDTTPITEKNAKFVLEVNYESGIQPGDRVILDELEDYLEDRLEKLEEQGDIYDEIEDSDSLDIPRKEKKEREEIIVTLQILDTDGSVQGKIESGARIFSRKNTKVLIRQAKKAEERKTDSAYKRLGNSVFKYIKIQNSNDPEYVELKEYQKGGKTKKKEVINEPPVPDDVVNQEWAKESREKEAAAIAEYEAREKAAAAQGFDIYGKPLKSTTDTTQQPTQPTQQTTGTKKLTMAEAEKAAMDIIYPYRRNIPEGFWNDLVGFVKALGPLGEGQKFSNTYIAGILGNIMQESKFNPNAVSEIGAKGYLQYLNDRHTAYNKYLTDNNLTNTLTSLGKYLQYQYSQEAKRRSDITNYQNLVKELHAKVPGSEAALGGHAVFYDNLNDTTDTDSGRNKIRARVREILAASGKTLGNYSDLMVKSDSSTFGDQWEKKWTDQNGVVYNSADSRALHTKIDKGNTPITAKHFMDIYVRPGEKEAMVDKRIEYAENWLPVVRAIRASY